MKHGLNQIPKHCLIVFNVLPYLYHYHKIFKNKIIKLFTEEYFVGVF